MANEKRLIDANALISYFSGGEAMKTMTQSIYDAMFVKALQEAPTVDAVEVAHGRWEYGTRSAVCSKCGFERHLDDNFGAAIACPNCGAKMDGDGNG